jgi:hypothetical protein
MHPRRTPLQAHEVRQLHEALVEAEQPLLLAMPVADAEAERLRSRACELMADLLPLLARLGRRLEGVRT